MKNSLDSNMKKCFHISFFIFLCNQISLGRCWWKLLHFKPEPQSSVRCHGEHVAFHFGTGTKSIRRFTKFTSKLTRPRQWNRKICSGLESTISFWHRLASLVEFCEPKLSQCFHHANRIFLLCFVSIFCMSFCFFNQIWEVMHALHVPCTQVISVQLYWTAAMSSEKREHSESPWGGFDGEISPPMRRLPSWEMDQWRLREQHFLP